MKKSLLIFTFLLGSPALFAQKKASTFSKTDLVFSAIKGTTSKIDSVEIAGFSGKSKPGELSIVGENAGYFKLLSGNSATRGTEKTEVVRVAFSPPTDFVGIAKATLKLGKSNLSVNLTGLSTNGLEGENEPPLARVVEALGYRINIGWTKLANHWRPELQGDEVPPCLFKKAGAGEVEIRPVARYSPDFLLNFGYYTSSAHGPQQRQVGVLAKAGKFPEHQTLFPALTSGKTTFDPSDKPFGFYAISPSHTAYSEDVWNILFYPTHATHAVRTYPVNDKAGTVLKNTYLVCIEEAANGDYNDYVFLVSNVQPVPLTAHFSPLFNGKNFEGWASWLQTKGRNNDPDRVFTVEKDGIIHDTGQELGYLITQAAFRNYHFILDFKWGEKRWPPRENNKRDSGICYNVPADEADAIWPQSVECQIQEGDVGDFWLLANSTIQVGGKQNFPSAHTQMVKKKDNEKPIGEWNTVEVISFNGKCVHVINGVVVNYGENSSLVGGRILLQSEYAEVYYRNIRLRALN